MPSFHHYYHDGAAAAPLDAAEDHDARHDNLDDVDGAGDDAEGPDHAAADAREDHEGEADRRGKFKCGKRRRREEGGQRVCPHRQPLPQLVHLVDQHHGHERGAGDARGGR